MKQVGFLFLLTFLFSSCTKEVVDQDMVDQEVIVNYLTTNKLTMTKDPSGIHYNIINPGVGNNPSPTATVEVRYKG
ncbi:MAG: hypothetical protein NWR22_08765, partial [Saprospiraceae bacterium]|nr:hypothetical protein [Saprospiraceae bacterium]